MEQVLRTAPSADGYFQLGQIYLQQGEVEKAEAAFVNARQHDLLRFRAPKQINDIIRHLAERPGVELVDAEAALATVAPNGIIGNSLMIEHLHPTVSGYFEIADSFYSHLIQSLLLGPFEVAVTREAAIKDMPIFPAEEYWGEAKIAVLMADYPFTDEPSPPEFAPIENWSDELGMLAYRKQKTWLDIAQTSMRMAQKEQDWPTFIKAARLLADAMPDNFDYNMQAGRVLIQFRHADQSLRYLKRATGLAPSDVNAKLALAHAFAELQRLDDALVQLKAVLTIEPENQTALVNIEAIEAFQAKKAG